MYLTLNLPAVEPLGEAVSNREMFGRLARRMGFHDGIFTMSDEQVIRDVALDWSHPAWRASASTRCARPDGRG